MYDLYDEKPDALEKPAVVLVDEIDLHMHPKFQRKLFDFLTTKFPNTQFIVTAHSPLIVQASTNANIAILKKEGDHVERNFTFKPSVYGDSAIKQALEDAQYGKCCFCEVKVKHVAYGDIEHFRPKGGFRQNESDSLGKPGYYWLAYDWDNLLFSCQICNQRYKKNLFPLENPDQRALNHQDDISLENPVFIHSVNDNPEDHISFKREIPIPLTQRGAVSINNLGLDREKLNENRLEKLQPILLLLDIIHLLPNSVQAEHAREFIFQNFEPEAEYSSMMKANFSNLDIN